MVGGSGVHFKNEGNESCLFFPTHANHYALGRH